MLRVTNEEVLLVAELGIISGRREYSHGISNHEEATALMKGLTFGVESI